MEIDYRWWYDYDDQIYIIQSLLFPNVLARGNSLGEALEEFNKAEANVMSSLAKDLK